MTGKFKEARNAIEKLQSLFPPFTDPNLPAVISEQVESTIQRTRVNTAEVIRETANPPGEADASDGENANGPQE